MISILEDIVAGGAAGALGVFIGVPFDTCKVRMQSIPSKFKTGFQTFRDTLKLEGVTAFYKGSSAPIAAQFVICAFAFAGESFGIKMLEPPSSRAQPSSLNAFLAGSFGGLVQCFALVPSDLVKCKMQVDSNSSLRQCEFSSVSDCIRKTVNSEGIAGLFRGMGISVLREVPSYGFYFLAYRSCKDYLTKRFAAHRQTKNNAVELASFIGGGIAGSATWALVYPIDVVKSVIQTSPLNSPKEQLKSSYVTLKILKERGPVAFYRGLGVTVLRAFPVNAATFYFYELFQRWFAGMHA